MKVAIMQPYFLPYIGYWQLISSVDVFVVYDNIEFSKNGWFHRNNILQNDKKELFSIPIKKQSDTLHVVERSLAENVKKDITKSISKIKNNYIKAPYFKEVFPLIEDIFLYQDSNLFRYIYYSIEQICKYLKIETKLIVSSEIPIDHTLKAQEKVIAIVKELGSDTYINAIGGRELYSYDEFKQEGISLQFLDSDILKYQQYSDTFIGYLSIIDILMFNSQDEAIAMLDTFQLLGNQDK